MRAPLRPPLFSPSGITPRRALLVDLHDLGQGPRLLDVEGPRGPQAPRRGGRDALLLDAAVLLRLHLLQRLPAHEPLEEVLPVSQTSSPSQSTLSRVPRRRRVRRGGEWRRGPGARGHGSGPRRRTAGDPRRPVRDPRFFGPRQHANARLPPRGIPGWPRGRAGRPRRAGRPARPRRLRDPVGPRCRPRDAPPRPPCAARGRGRGGGGVGTPRSWKGCPSNTGAARLRGRPGGGKGGSWTWPGPGG